MKPENLKSVAASLMEQRISPSSSSSPVVEDHPDKDVVRQLFGETHSYGRIQESSSVPSSSGLDLSALSPSSPSSGTKTSLREDLVQQAAQSLVKNQNDAFLSITQRMSSDEIALALKTARQWRRPDQDWQDSFKSAPETGFSFIDRKNPKKGKSGKSGSGGNKAEALAESIVSFMRENKFPATETEKIVRKVVRGRKLRMSESQLRKFVYLISSVVSGA